MRRLALHAAIGLLALAALRSVVQDLVFAVLIAHDPRFVQTDFGIFYASGRAILKGQSPYLGVGSHNMNPPLVAYTLFGPLAHLSPPSAALVWALLGLLSVSASLWALWRELRPAPDRFLAFVALVMLSEGAAVSWAAGQMTWILLYPLTRGWIAYRNGRILRASGWLSPVIAAKPIFAVMPLFLGWPLTIFAGIGSATLTAVTIALTGWAPFADWLHAIGGVTWGAWPANASLWGFSVRLAGVQAKQAVDWSVLWPTVPIIALTVAVGLWWLLRRLSPDPRWAAASVATLLLSPLGWIYYWPLCAVPLLACWRQADQRVFWLSLAALCLPVDAIWTSTPQSPWFALTVGSLFWWALLGMLTAILLGQLRLLRGQVIFREVPQYVERHRCGHVARP